MNRTNFVIDIEDIECDLENVRDDLQAADPTNEKDKIDIEQATKLINTAISAVNEAKSWIRD